MTLVENYNFNKWQTIDRRIPKVGEYIHGYQNINNRFKQVVYQVDQNEDIKQEAFILQLIEVK
jgi:uncharacterized alpha/beta hydrolase family protein